MAIRLTDHGALAVITIDRADALNALDQRLIREIGAAIDEVGASEARALLFVGAGGKAFSAGADVKELQACDAAAQRAAMRLGQSTFAKLDRLKAPSIAVIRGFALGGGLELAMACTFRVATPEARMGLPEIKLGLIPGYGGTQRLPRLIGPARAKELIMSGRTIDAAEAERIGLVNAVVAGEDPIEIGRGFAERFIQFSPSALLFAREAVEAATSTSLNEGLEIEADRVARAFQTEDAREGMAAFSERRPPRFPSIDGSRLSAS